jgi:iron complex outermembrane receptor protein
MKNLPTLRILAIIVFCAGRSAGSSAALQQVADIADLSLEQLTRITVTSASRREERLLEAPASIFVITAEDIRRSGANTLGEALRLAPNLHVARVDSNQYAISARGASTTTANRMLVLLDGRTIYSPLFSGVFWDAQDVMLEDVERIEVISGPAATLWGSNGVNGVINITTLSSAKTRGVLFSVGGGDISRGVTARLGGELGADGSYRVYGKYLEGDRRNLASGAELRDDAKRGQVGFRADWERALDTFTFQGDAYKADVDNPGGSRDLKGANLVGRWRGKREDSDFRLQVYYDRTEREHFASFTEVLDTFDVEFQQSSKRWSTHMLVWGGGYRFSRDVVGNTPALAFIPATRNMEWGDVFVQDEVVLRPDLRLTLGLKAETNPYTHLEWLPNLRLAWQPSASSLLWGALSRAVRAPSRIDRDLYAPGVPPYVVLAGNDTFRSEIANVLELGYRAQVSADASFSLTAFHHEFSRLRSIELSPEGLRVIANGIEGRLTGIEGWGSYRVVPSWKLTGGFVVLDQKLTVSEGHVDLGGLPALGNDPKNMVKLRSAWDITPRHEFDLSARYVGALPNPAVPAYAVVDARLGWRVSKSLELSLTVQNAFDRNYAEFGAPATRAMFERNFFVKATWKL